MADPVADEARGLRMLEEASRSILEGVARELPGWVERQVTALLDAWTGSGADLPAPVRARAVDDAQRAGTAATGRVVGALRELFERDPAAQRATPLELVRSAYREPTAVLAAAGVPGVVREEFDVHAWPDDEYGLVPRTLGDLGDPDLGPLQLAWGVAKATVLRARATKEG